MSFQEPLACIRALWINFTGQIYLAKFLMLTKYSQKVNSFPYSAACHLLSYLIVRSYLGFMLIIGVGVIL